MASPIIINSEPDDPARPKSARQDSSAPAPAPATPASASGSSPRLPLPGSSARNRAVVLNPTASGIRRVLDGPAEGVPWGCEACLVPLSKEDIVGGHAKLTAGRLFCARCLRPGRARDAQARTLRTALLVLLGASAAAAPFFPGPVLFLLLLAGVSVALTGALGFSMCAQVRFALLGGGLAASAASLWALKGVYSQEDFLAERDAMRRNLAGIQVPLQEDRYAEAQGRLLVFESAAQRLPGQFVSRGAETAVREAQQLFERWFCERYGNLGADERRLLGLLFTRFSVRTASGALRFNEFHLEAEGRKIRLRACVDAEPGASDEGQRQGEAVLALLFAAAPRLQEVEVRLASCSASGVEQEWGTFRASPDSMHPFRLKALK